MTDEKKSYLKFTEQKGLMPQEETLEVEHGKKKWLIGIPRETDGNERRIPLSPSSVYLLVKNGHKVVIQENAGKEAHFTNAEYAESGAEIVPDAATVFKSDIIAKISAPSEEEIEMLERNKMIFSTVFLQDRNREYFQKLLSKKINAIAYEYIKDKTGAFPLVRSMSEIIGNAAIMIAAEYLSHPEFGKGVMLGGFPGIPPSVVVILGAGTVAEYAARTALGMGAEVKIFDDSIYKMRDLQNRLPARVYTSTLQPPLLLKAFREADVVIGAKHSATGLSPCIIPLEMVKEMKSGAVIVDVSIDQGGCFETSRSTSHTHPAYKEEGITHYCVPNIASRVPHTASYSISNFLAPLINRLSEAGSLEQLISQDKAFGKGVYIYNGILTNEGIGKKFGLSYRDLDLLMAAFQ
ncbi:MAG: alanine dehydrogenase [Bacteroidales bacterium]|nr:alanine dehydrogenase [Bacteroidales bacterium]